MKLTSYELHHLLLGYRLGYRYGLRMPGITHEQIYKLAHTLKVSSSFYKIGFVQGVQVSGNMLPEREVTIMGKLGKAQAHAEKQATANFTPFVKAAKLEALEAVFCIEKIRAGKDDTGLKWYLDILVDNDLACVIESSEEASTVEERFIGTNEHCQCTLSVSRSENGNTKRDIMFNILKEQVPVHGIFLERKAASKRGQSYIDFAETEDFCPCGVYASQTSASKDEEEFDPFLDEEEEPVQPAKRNGNHRQVQQPVNTVQAIKNKTNVVKEPDPIKEELTSRYKKSGTPFKSRKRDEFNPYEK